MRILLRILFITLYSLLYEAPGGKKKHLLILESIMDVSLLSHQIFLLYESYAFCN